MISLHFSYYWLLLPLVVILLIWIGRTDGGSGYGAGLATVMVTAGALIIFFVVLAAMLAFNLWTK